MNNIKEILNSDFKLWEQSSTEQDGTTVIKTVSLPYGIGEFTLRFEGVKDAEARRGAAAIWGQAIRDTINDAVGDESVTARAAQKAARVGEDDGGHGRLEQPNKDDAGPEEIPAEEAVPPLGEAPSTGSVTRDKLDGLRQRRNDYAKRIKGLDLEIKALQAYLEVINAQEVSETSHDSDSGEVQEETS